LYTVNQVRILWAGFASDYFFALNGVKQGHSPILFCIYIDDLLTRLSSSGVGCYVGLDFAGALCCAYYILLFWHLLLLLCSNCLLFVTQTLQNTILYFIQINLNSWLWPRISGTPCIISCATAISSLVANHWKMLNSIHIWAILSVPLLEILRMYSIDAIALLAKQTIFFVSSITYISR
jgi:hypothetical protein